MLAWIVVLGGLPLSGEESLAVIRPRPANLIREQGRNWLAWDRPLPALAAAADAVVRVPGSAQAWAQLAAALYRNSDFQRAEAAARRALELHPGDPDALVALARCLEIQGASEASLRQLEEAVRVDPFHPAAPRLLAAQLDPNDDRVRIILLMQRFLELKPQGPSGKMFAQHARQAVEVFKALGDTVTDEQPAWAERPERVAARLAISEDEPLISLEFPRVGKLEFLFDTGEESITLSPRTVKAIGAKKIGALPAATATGLEMMDVVLVSELRLGGFVIRNIVAGVGTSDIIGPTVFAGYRVKMDFARKQLVLARQPEDAQPGPRDLEPAAGDAEGIRRVRFLRQGGLVWFPVQTPNEAAPLRARKAWGFLDTGCQPPGLLFPRYLEALHSEPGKGPKSLPFRSSLGGAARDGQEQIMRVLPEFTVTYLGAEVRADKAISAESLGPINQSMEAELDLIVGWPMIQQAFKSIEIDYERCVLTLEPRELKARK